MLSTYWKSADAAAALSIPGDPALDDKLIRIVIRIQLVFPEPVGSFCSIKNGCYGRTLRTTANQVPADTCAGQRRNTVDDNAFAGAGLACHDIESGPEMDVCVFNYRYIFNFEFTQHAFPRSVP